MADRAQFQWDDPFLFEEQLSEREACPGYRHDYGQEKLMPRVLEMHRHETFDRDIFYEMGELGLFGTTLPEMYGGADLNHVCYGLVTREIERVDSGFRRC